MYWKYYFSLLNEILVPRRCGICGDEIHDGFFCTPCREEFVLNKKQTLNGTIRNLYLLMRYEGVLRECIHRIKFRGGRKLLPWMQEEAIRFFGQNLENFIGGYDIIDTIPTSVDRVQERGYDVPREIFNFFPLAKKPVLERIHVTRALYNLMKEQREKELKGCFRTVVPVVGKRVLLLDDIYTTGATAAEAAGCLLKSGAMAVDFVGFTGGRNNWE